MGPARAALLVACGLAGPGAALADWRLDYEEVFAANGRLNTGFWDTETGHLRNRELQYYAPANVVVQGGVLSLQARRERVPNAAHVPGSSGWRTRSASSRFTSGSIVTRGRVHFGRYEFVARAPAGPGMWPAIWLLHEREGEYGEIDLFEAVGKHPGIAWAGVHWGREARTRRHRNGSLPVPGMEGSWRTHTLEWTPQLIRVLVDGQEMFRFDPGEAASAGFDPLRQPMRLRINLALGGSWGGPLDEARLPASFDIASIRIWSWQPGPATAAAPVPAPDTAAPLPPADPPPPAPPPLRWGR